MRKLEDISNQKFNRLTAIRFEEKRLLGKKKYDFWRFKCDCGTEKTINKKSVVQGQTKSCGCLHRENVPRLPEGEASFNTLLYVYKTNAKKRNLDFELSAEKFRKLTSERCTYCGDPPKLQFNRPPSNNPFNGSYSYNGIDRVDNDVGYIEANCVPCCETCNRAKLEMSTETFLTWISKVYKFSLGEADGR